MSTGLRTWSNSWPTGSRGYSLQPGCDSWYHQWDYLEQARRLRALEAWILAQNTLVTSSRCYRQTEPSERIQGAKRASTEHRVDRCRLPFAWNGSLLDNPFFQSPTLSIEFQWTTYKGWILFWRRRDDEDDLNMAEWTSKSENPDEQNLVRPRRRATGRQSRYNRPLHAFLND